MSEPHKRRRHSKYKTSYRVRNWPEYKKSLRSRGDVTIWLSQEVIDAWTPAMTGKRGRQPSRSRMITNRTLRKPLIY